jgi:hypothetical protein
LTEKKGWEIGREGKGEREGKGKREGKGERGGEVVDATDGFTTYSPTWPT